MSAWSRGFSHGRRQIRQEFRKQKKVFKQNVK